VFWNKVLRRMFITERDEMTGEQRKLRGEELDDFYIIMMTLAWTSAECG
jgi:hypothetical protein